MKHRISDFLQFTAAIILTGGLIASAAPLPSQELISEPVEVVQEASAIETQVEPEKAVETIKKEPEAAKKVAEPPKVDWKTNPNKCNTDTQWIYEDGSCHDKKIVEKSASPVATSPPVVSVGGSCSDWIAAAGIGDLANANELIRRESGCNPHAVNPSSGACGVAQELPCGKSGCSLGDGACQVKWMNSYVKSRYGTWAAAVYHHDLKNWY